MRTVRPPIPDRKWEKLLETRDETGRDLAPLNHYVRSLWLSSSYLRQEFPIDSKHGRTRLADWLVRINDSEFDLQSWLLPWAKRRTPAVPGAVGGFTPGVNLVEHPRATLGIREDTRLNRLALESRGVPCSHLQIFNSENDPEQAARTFRHRVNLVHVNADQMLFAFGQLGPQLWDGRYTIGYWLWELPLCPPAWYPSFEVVDEIWVPSRFVYETFARVSPVPVVHLPYPVVAEADTTLTRTDFGLPEERFLVMTSFDISSFAARKNPMASIEAFQRAFPPGDDRAGLVVKAANAHPEHPAWRELLERAENDPRLRLINEVMERPRLLALLRLCDAYISLHRSEGFGRGPAEAMLLGKPVVVTDFSGSADYCSDETACLVDFRLVAVGEKDYPFARSQVWAEPDVDQAAAHLERLLDDEPRRRQLAGAGQRLIRSRYNLHTVGQRYAERLRALGLLPQ